MIQETYNNYTIQLIKENLDTPLDQLFSKYESHLFPNSKPTGNYIQKHEIKIFESGRLYKSTLLIHDEGGATTIHKTCYLIFEDQLIICIGNYIMSLSIPDLNLQWSMKAQLSIKRKGKRTYRWSPSRTHYFEILSLFFAFAINAE